jgi:hypothetical protein
MQRHTAGGKPGFPCAGRRPSPRRALLANPLSHPIVRRLDSSGPLASHPCSASAVASLPARRLRPSGAGRCVVVRSASNSSRNPFSCSGRSRRASCPGCARIHAREQPHRHSTRRRKARCRLCTPITGVKPRETGLTPELRCVVLPVASFPRAIFQQRPQQPKTPLTAPPQRHAETALGVPGLAGIHARARAGASMPRQRLRLPLRFRSGFRLRCSSSSAYTLGVVRVYIGRSRF